MTLTKFSVYPAMRHFKKSRCVTAFGPSNATHRELGSLGEGVIYGAGSWAVINLTFWIAVQRLITEHPDRSNLGRSVAESRTKSINEAFARIKAEWSQCEITFIPLETFLMFVSSFSETKNKVSPKKAPEYAPAAKFSYFGQQIKAQLTLIFFVQTSERF